MTNIDSNSNRMFREDMGACNDGCKCQSRWIFYMVDGDIADIDLVSNCPCILRKDDNYYTKQFEKVVINNEQYRKVPCDLVDVNIHDYRDLILDDFLNNKPDGMYVLDIEFACFERYVWDYGCYEGDGDYAAILHNQEPLTEETIDKFLEELK